MDIQEEESEVGSTITENIANFFKRNTAPIKKGSLRLATINLMICGTSGTFFWYPVIFKNFGYLPGILVILMILAISYLTSMFLIECSEESEVNDYLNLIEHYLGSTFKKISSITLSLDYFSCYIIGFLLTYNILLYLGYVLNYLDPDTAISTDILTFD